MVKIVKSFAAQTFAADIRKVKQVSQGETSIACESIEHSPSRDALEDDPQGESFGASAIVARTAAKSDVLTKF
jgi:hypothetical protein